MQIEQHDESRAHCCLIVDYQNMCHTAAGGTVIRPARPVKSWYASRMSFPIDLTRAETTPFSVLAERPNDPGVHQLLATFAGRWRGPTRLWLDPAAPPEQTVMELEAATILGGRWLELSYQGVAMGKPHAGRMLIGFHGDAGEVELAWVDSFHTGSAIMLSKGRPAGATVDVLGSYVAGDQRWGWRTKLEVPFESRLVLRAFNVAPSGEEYPAIESLLGRVEA